MQREEEEGEEKRETTRKSVERKREKGREREKTVQTAGKETVEVIIEEREIKERLMTVWERQESRKENEIKDKMRKEEEGVTPEKQNPSRKMWAE